MWLTSFVVWHHLRSTLTPEQTERVQAVLDGKIPTA
jgi:hypothetical protein